MSFIVASPTLYANLDTISILLLSFGIFGKILHVFLYLLLPKSKPIKAKQKTGATNARTQLVRGVQGWRLAGDKK